MSLRHAVLGVLSAEPMTGYDLVEFIDDSVGYVWSTGQSQAYPELRKMEAEGLICPSVAPRGQRAEKRIYSITPAGLEELRRWVDEDLPYPPLRDAHKLQALFFDYGTPDAVRGHLHNHVAYWTRKLTQWEARSQSVQARRFPLIRKRLATRPAADHDAIVAFKVWTFEGMIERARTEIAWAQRGIQIVDELFAQAGQVGGP